MKLLKNKGKKKFLKKVFVKLARLAGYEIIDQFNYNVPTSSLSLGKNLCVPGLKNITVPLGEVEVTRKIYSLHVIFRSCTSNLMLTQSKKRIFSEKKAEYTIRSLHSILKSLNKAKKLFKDTKFKITISDTKSSDADLLKIKNLLLKFNYDFTIDQIKLDKFKDKIDKNSVSENQYSNMANIYSSYCRAKNGTGDLYYFVEDDYIHQEKAILEMLLTYERISSLLKKEIIICPADYPYLYFNFNPSTIFIGNKSHWRSVNETLCTFLTSKKMLLQHWDLFISMAKKEHLPFEKPLHEIYKKELCISPIPSLAMHCTNVNSIYGLPPNFDWEKAWEDNKYQDS
jgi:hypothetical protein